MNVFRKQTTRAGSKETIFSKRWCGTLTLANGKRKQIPLSEAKASSLALLKRLQREQDTSASLRFIDALARANWPGYMKIRFGNAETLRALRFRRPAVAGRDMAGESRRMDTDEHR